MAKVFAIDHPPTHSAIQTETERGGGRGGGGAVVDLLYVRRGSQLPLLLQWRSDKC